MIRNGLRLCVLLACRQGCGRDRSLRLSFTAPGPEAKSPHLVCAARHLAPQLLTQARTDLQVLIQAPSDQRWLALHLVPAARRLALALQLRIQARTDPQVLIQRCLAPHLVPPDRHLVLDLQLSIQARTDLQLLVRPPLEQRWAALHLVPAVSALQLSIQARTDPQEIPPPRTQHGLRGVEAL